MTWQEQEIEKVTKKRLEDEFKSQGEAWYANYVVAKNTIAKDLLPNIRAVEPGLTDHGPDHVKDVLFRAGQLLSDRLTKIPSQDLYILILSILFHDVGNIFKRDDHQKKISKVLYHVWPDRKQHKWEHRILKQSVMAHCGVASDGSKDTLKEVEETASLESHPVNLREIAAITRFADELAEGPQRTSAFMIEKGLIPEESKKFHEYAFQTEILIDKKSERIALTYDVGIDVVNNSDWEKDVESALTLIYDRIVKLDQERQYTKYYCQHLAPYKQTTVALNFYVDGTDFPINLKQITLTDLKVPGDKQKGIVEHDSNYSIENIINSIKKYKSDEEN